MNRKSLLGLALVFVCSGWMDVRAQTPLSTAFTYQGQLKSGGSPAGGSYDLRFTLWDASSAGSQVGTTQCSDNVNVANGLFTVTLDFGAQFNGSARWLEIGVRADTTAGNCTSGSYTTLSARQPLTAAPYASFAGAPWATSGSNISYTNGNVGIGNAKLLGYNPSDSFSYDGKTMGHYTAGWFNDSWNAFGATAWLSGYAGVKFFTNGGLSMAINQGGNVGIGTTNPVAPLSLGDYQGGTAGSGVGGYSKQMALTGAYNTGTNTGNSVKLWIGDYDNDGTADIYPIYCEDENNGVDFYIRNNHALAAGGSRTAYFGGNVGIGNSNPTARLSFGNVLGDLIALNGDAGGPHFGIGIQSSRLQIHTAIPGQDILFGTGSSASFAEVMRIQGSGNVGIGTTNPGAPLDVGGRVLASNGGGDGALDIVNNSGQEVAYMATGSAHTGLLGVTQPGTFAVRAGAYWDPTTNKGILSADLKNFREPDAENPSQDIVYACVEGPEAAMYVRGTATLANGRAVISLPDHFRKLAVEAGMTVQLTPLDPSSRGLCVVHKGLDGVQIAELSNGAGNYSFDWRVEAVRKGYEDYRVTRPWDELLSSSVDRDKAWQSRLANVEARRQRQSSPLAR